MATALNSCIKKRNIIVFNILRPICFVVGLAWFAASAAELNPSMELNAFRVCPSDSMPRYDSVELPQARMDSSLSNAILDVTYHWLSRVHNQYMNRVAGTFSGDREKKCKGYFTMSYQVNKSGKVEDVLVSECNLGYSDLCSYARQYFETRRYNSFKIPQNLFVSFTLIFTPDDKSIVNISDIPSFQDHWKTFKKKYPKDHY